MERSDADGKIFFEAENQGDSYSWLTNRVLEESWSITVDFNIEGLLVSGGLRGSASIALAIDHIQPQLRLLAEVNRHQDGFALLELFYYDTVQGWQNVLSSDWQRTAETGFRLNIERRSTSPVLTTALTSATGITLFRGSTASVPLDLLDLISAIGLRVIGSKATFTNLSLISPLVGDETATNIFRRLGICAVTDLLGHFWSGAYSTGQVVNTWNGYIANLSDPRGGLWERATLLFAFDALERATGNDRWRQRIAADWRHTAQAYSPSELEACGSGTPNPACDDAGWSALMYLAARRASADPQALARAQGIVSNALNRWIDTDLGGGMWYSDSRNVKSLYQTALILASLRIYDLTTNIWMYSNALACATWIETHLLRSDGLYWCDYNSSGPVGSERPYDIHEADSVTFLGGNMAMGTIHAWRYRRSGDDSYRLRAIRTATAIYAYLRQAGVLLNDRDAWTQGTFAADWAAEVLTLPGIAGSHWQLLRSTAESIALNARTYLGYYGGSWSGPSEGEDSKWWLALSRPEQIMTSASSVSFIAAAALLEAQDSARSRPALLLQRCQQPAYLNLSLLGEPGWTYALETTPDLTNWNSRNVLLMATSHTNLVVSSTNAAEFYRARIYFDP